VPVMKVGMVSDGWVKDADRVGGFPASQTSQANTIPVAGSTGKLDAGWLPAVGNLNMVEFTSSTTWNVPSGVTKIMVFAIAGGGGGGGAGPYGGGGGTGGTTSIVGSNSGTLVSLSGGGGGGANAGFGSGAGVSYSGVAGGVLRYYDGTSLHVASGFGAGSPFGGGGRSIGDTSARGEDGNGYGSGGSGGCYSGAYCGGGGGSGQCVLGAVYSVSSGETLTITIGAGGNGGGGGSGGYAGGNGKPGFVRIIYFA
jgi:hypothetical protein